MRPDDEAMEILVTKLVRTPRLTMACVYHLPDRELAVEVQILELYRKKLGPTYRRSVRSLKTFKPTISAKAHHQNAAPPTSGVTGGAVLALTAWVAILCMWIGAMGTQFLLRQP